jgi:hypothetical protein
MHQLLGLLLETKENQMEQRTRENITQDYNFVCANLGDRYFKSNVLNAEIAVLSKKLEELNREANDLLVAEKTDKPAEQE